MSTTLRLVISAAVLAAVGAATVGAALIAVDAERDRGFVIDAYDREVTVLDDGRLDVVETQQVTFLEPRRGIIRDLERAGPGDFLATYEVTAVERADGSPWTFTTSTLTGGDLAVRIGDAAVTLEPGPQTYRLRYSVGNLLFRPRARPDVVQVRLDVPGDGTPTDVTTTALSLQLPAPATASACVLGRAGSTQICPRPVEVDGTRATVTLPALRPFETGTVMVEFPADALPADVPLIAVDELDDRARAPLDLPMVPATVVTLLALALPAAALETLRARIVYRDRVTDPALHDRAAPTAELEPPDDLTPVEVAGVLQRGAGEAGLLATLSHLEIRGVVTSSSPDDGDLRFGPGERPQDASAWEAEVLQTLMPDGEPLALGGTYERGRARRVTAARRVVDQRLNGVFDHGSPYVHDGGGALRGGGYVAAIAAVLVVGAFLGLAAIAVLAVPVAAVVVAWAGLGIAWLLLTWLWRRQRLPLSSRGRDVVARGEAFRTFLFEVHADRLRFAASRGDVGALHPAVALLPYAIALGMADEWLERFAPLIEEARTADRAGHVGGDAWFLTTAGYASARSRYTSTTTAPSSSGGGSGGSFGGGGAGSGGGGGGTRSW